MLAECNVKSWIKIKWNHGEIRQRRAAGGEQKGRLQYGWENPQSPQIEEVSLPQVIKLVSINRTTCNTRQQINEMHRWLAKKLVFDWNIFLPWPRKKFLITWERRLLRLIFHLLPACVEALAWTCKTTRATMLSTMHRWTGTSNARLLFCCFNSASELLHNFSFRETPTRFRKRSQFADFRFQNCFSSSRLLAMLFSFCFRTMTLIRCC